MLNEYITIITSLLIFLFPYIGRLWFNRTHLANTVITLGVLGTFSGIFLGLQDFDILHVETALPQLLEGLKTAFLTSIAGMCSSLILKLYPAFYGVKTENQPNQEDENERLFALFARIEANTAASTEALVSQLTLLNQSFRSFTDHVSRLNAEALTTALRHVMDKWDSQVSEQLRPTLLEMQDLLQKLTDMTSDNNQQLKNIEEHLRKTTEALQKTADQVGNNLNKTMTLSHKQHEAVSGQIDRLGDLMQTSEAHWEKQMTEMEERFKRELSAMEQFTKTLLTIIKKLSQDHQTLTKRQAEEN